MIRSTMLSLILLLSAPTPALAAQWHVTGAFRNTYPNARFDKAGWVAISGDDGAPVRGLDPRNFRILGLGCEGTRCGVKATASLAVTEQAPGLYYLTFKQSEGPESTNQYYVRVMHVYKFASQTFEVQMGQIFMP